MRKFLSVCKSKMFGLSAGIGTALLCGHAFAEETTTTPAERLTTALQGVFTFHYGKIKRYVSAIKGSRNIGFTFHYGKIKRLRIQPGSTCASAFTFHYGKIKRMGTVRKSV